MENNKFQHVIYAMTKNHLSVNQIIVMIITFLRESYVKIVIMRGFVHIAGNQKYINLIRKSKITILFNLQKILQRKIASTLINVTI